jgi:hypothetical protein
MRPSNSEKVHVYQTKMALREIWSLDSETFSAVQCTVWEMKGAESTIRAIQDYLRTMSRSIRHLARRVPSKSKLLECVGWMENKN